MLCATGFAVVDCSDYVTALGCRQTVAGCINDRVEFIYS